MNERFKFRVWDKQSNSYIKEKMFYIDESGFPFKYEKSRSTVYMNAPSPYVMCPCRENYIVEQCTGLKDKNGELIYENDLIKCPSGIYRIAVDDFGLWTAIYENNPLKGVVEWSDIVKEYAFNQENVEIEVLGNINENADLIKVGEK